MPSQARYYLGIHLTGAGDAAQSIPEDDQGNDVITIKEYGDGRVIYSSVDLLDQIVYEINNDLEPDWLLSAAGLVELSHPEALSYSPGRVLPVHITVVNEGVDVSVRILGDTGDGIAIADDIDVGDPGLESTDSGLAWSFTLAEGETRDLVIWLRMLESSESEISFR